MNCMRLENSQQFLMRCSKLGAAAGSDDSISARPRFREDMATAAVTEEVESNGLCSMELSVCSR